VSYSQQPDKFTKENSMAQLRNKLEGYLEGGLEPIAGGFIFTEGPVWHPEGYLLFSDMPGDVRRRWSPSQGVTVVRQPANKCNGMAYDEQGRLLVCEHSTSRLIREDGAGNSEVLAGSYQGSELNSPNDVVVAFNGDIFFTDPTYGRTPDFGLAREPELEYRGLYRLSPDGALGLVDVDFAQPNGLCFDPGESVLYVNDTERGVILVYPRLADGSLGPRSVFADGIGDVDFEVGVVDGMKCDAEGNVLVTGPNGIWVFDSSGNHLGVIEVPEVVGNLNWGDAGWTTLYITASTSVYRVETAVPGAVVPNMRRVEMSGGEDV
jgi:gluconolactonase